MSHRTATEREKLPTALDGCLEACRRCESLVDRILGSASPIAERAYAAIGPHLRHCLDHFGCLLRGLANGVVDYDAREREATLERDPGRFREVLDSIVDGLRGLASTDEQTDLRVRQAAASDGRTAELPSNLERELAFLSGHTIHHLAIMRLLAEAQGIAIPEELVMAFSTQAYLDRVHQPG